jgi:hypothetical protein
MSSERKIVECKGCGAKMFFEHGIPWYAKRVPILVQKVKTMNDDGTATMEYVKDIGHVSHFVNCPKVGEFSASKKKEVG